MLKKSQSLLLTLALLGSSLPVIAEQEMKETYMPRDMIEFTCNEFEQKVKDCESYTCKTPSVLDPTLTTEWKVIEKKNERCVISNTISDVGLKNENGDPKPVTKTCEYDAAGIVELTQLMGQLSSGYFSTSDAGDMQGTHNCTITSDGSPIKAPPYSVSDDGE